MTDRQAMTLQVRDLGRMPYAHALAIQREVNLAVSLGTEQPTLLLVEHDPVITVTHRQSAWDNLLAPASKLEELGIAVEITDRGGDITYHGPGQLVAYPILKLNPLGLNLGSYMRLLEEIVIDVVVEFGVKGQRDPGATGVWVDVSGIGCRAIRFFRSPIPEPRYPTGQTLRHGRPRPQEHDDARPGIERHHRPVAFSDDRPVRIRRAAGDEPGGTFGR